MRKLTNCLKLSKQIDQSNKSLNNRWFTLKTPKKYYIKYHKIHQSVGKEQIKLMKIVITHLEMESETLQPLPAQRTISETSNPCPLCSKA